MRAISRTPTFNIKAVLRETDLSADVLRVWERRYGLPMPQRTPGGHRLYSEYDIETVKWLRSRQAEGLNISRAVEAWKELVAAGHDPLAEAVNIPDLLPAANTHIDVLRGQWLEAALTFDAGRAEEVINQAFAMYPAETVCIGIFQKGLSSIGDGWYEDRVTVQQEHFASALAVRRLETLLTFTPNPTRGRKILIGCPPGEWHVFPVLLLNLFLRRNGLNVIYLGANIPIEQLEETTAAIHPDLVVLAAQQLTSAATLRSVAVALQPKQVPLAYGGLIFNRVPGLCRRIPAHYLGESLSGAVDHIERLALAPTAATPAENVDPACLELARLFREKRPMIEMGMYDLLQVGRSQIEHLMEANAYFGHELSAALELGDPAWLEPDLEWIKRLLARREIPVGSLFPFLAAYRQMIHTVLGPAGAPVTDWISGYLERHGQGAQ